MPAIRLAVAGAGGRMGRALLHEITGDDRFLVTGSARRGDDPAELFKAADVVLDFSATTAAASHADLARTTHTGLLVGTTGLDEEAISALKAAAASAPILVAANTSVGMGLLAEFCRQAARRLGPDFRIEIEDIHHKDKKDAPSGTALMLGGIAADARGVKVADINITSERTGDFAGRHRVSFIGEIERIDLVHEAGDRAVFARGALDVAAWLAGQPPGYYTMADFLGSAGK